MSIRVFELARELGVKSKVVLERCKAEGVPKIDNHMTTVSIGLAESIRSWFHEDSQSETVTTAVATMDNDGDANSTEEAPTAHTTLPRTPAKPAKKIAKKAAKKAVARKKAVRKSTDSATARRAKRGTHRAHPGERVSSDTTATPRKRAKTASKTTTTKSTAKSPATPTHRGKEDTKHPTTVAEPATTHPGESTPTETPTQQSPSTTTDQPEQTLKPAASTTTEIETAAQAPQAHDTPDNPENPDSPRSIPNVPERPDTVTPAGPQLETQTPSKLSGPKVVRIEQADIIDKPRSRPRAARPAPGGRGAFNAPSDLGQAGEPGSGVSRRNTRRKTRGAGQTTRGRSGQSGRFAGGGGAGSGPTGKLHNWNEQDLIERQERLRGSHGFIRGLRRSSSDKAGERAKSARETGGVVKISEPFTIKKLSATTGVKATEILKALMNKGMMTTVNSGIETELAMEIMLEYNIELEVEEQKTAEDQVAEQFINREAVDVQPRFPVVTILGHVDHGKTSLLDQIRKTNVADGEAGGITQHTSAFRVSVKAGDEDKQIVFLDTPGHEAFTAMRARGAQVTDLVVLVVAADDGVMPQTIESINHAKAAEVPIIIALNKIDKPEATESNIQRIFGQLAEYDLSPVEWGGSTELIKCSALAGEGIQDILDTIDLQAQIMELTADFGGPARGTVLEARMVEGRGPVANILIREGNIKIGDFMAAGRAFGRVRDMTNDRGEKLKEAGPSTPIEISGLDRLPDAGDSFYIVDSLKMAQESAQHRVAYERELALAAPKVTLDNIFTTIDEKQRRDLNLIVKADAQGSLETLQKTLRDISTDEININIIHAAVGGITESDIILAEASQAVILGFHVIASHKARTLAEQKNTEIRNYQVIYELLDDVKKAASGLLEPELREEVIGHAEVREVFKVSKVGMIAGCYVTDGSVQRSARIRVTRQDIVIENNRVLEQLKRFKDDAKEVKAGQECGMKIEGYDDIKTGDILECYNVTEIAREL